jgi:hypothetical protein
MKTFLSWICRSYHLSFIMTSETANHCTFGATVEITDYARSVQGSTVSVAATLLPERKVEYRFFGVSVTVYVGKDNSQFKYET